MSETPSQSWYSALVDAVALITIATLAVLGKVDGTTAVVIIASLTSARVGVGLGKRMGALTRGPSSDRNGHDTEKPPPPTGVLVTLFFVFASLFTRKGV